MATSDQTGQNDHTINTSANVHGKLDNTTNQIRLLTFSPSPDRNDIHCELLPYCLHHAPAYTALSYARGKPQSEDSEENLITLNGKSWSVRDNLWSFLWQASQSPLRSKGRYWIDALCIDQRNTEERTQQVGMMGDIFGNAKTVLVWLGKIIPERRYVMHATLIESWFVPQPGQGFSAFSLLERPYWSRLWIVQELRLARDVVLACGSEEVTWANFAKWLDHICNDTSLQKHELAEQRAIRDSAAASMIENVHNCNQQPALYDQIIAFRHLECSDPVDKVYALLGIVKYEKEDIESDYARDITNVLHSVLRNHHARTSPTSLREVVNQCAELGTAVGLHNKALLSLKTNHGDIALLNGATLHQFPMHDGRAASLENLDTFLMLWWAEAYGHKVVKELWFARYRGAEIEQTFLRALRSGQYNLVKLIWQRKIINPNSEAVVGAMLTDGEETKALLLQHSNFVLNRWDEDGTESFENQAIKERLSKLMLQGHLELHMAASDGM